MHFSLAQNLHAIELRILLVQVPNGCGSALGAAQLILYAIYRNHKGDGTTDIANGDSVEMNDVKPAKNYEKNGEQV